MAKTDSSGVLLISRRSILADADITRTLVGKKDEKPVEEPVPAEGLLKAPCQNFPPLRH